MSYRLQKVNHLIRDEIAGLLQRHVKDPRLSSFISVTDVQTSPDMKHAKIFVSFIGSEEEKQKALSALAGAAGYFRHEMGNNLRMRTIPEISFHWDDSIERGSRILELIDQVESKENPAPNETL